MTTQQIRRRLYQFPAIQIHFNYWSGLGSRALKWSLLRIISITQMYRNCFRVVKKHKFQIVDHSIYFVFSWTWIYLLLCLQITSRMTIFSRQQIYTCAQFLMCLLPKIWKRCYRLDDHYRDVTWTSRWLKSLVTRLFVLAAPNETSMPVLLALNQRNRPVTPVADGFPSQRASNL